MTFNKPLFQIDCESIDSQDMQQDGQKVVEIITRALTDIAFSQGIA